MASAPTPATYGSLRDQVGQILSDGKVQSRQATEWEKADTYWHVGDAIYGHILNREGRAGYGERIIANLCKDLNLDRSLLHDIVLFRRAFPILYAHRQLTWYHYRALIRLPSIEQRHFYERMADDGGWSTRELQRQIKADLYRRNRNRLDALPEGEDPFGGRPFRVRRGRLYTYGLRKLPGSEGRIEDLRLDLGFDMLWRVDFKGIPNPRHGMIVTATKRGTGPGAEYRFEEAPGQRRKLYTHIANIVHVIDGDTMEAVADCGFNHATPQKLRLRGIDTPELSSRAGQRAREFVRARMNAVDFVVITTHRPGKFGRYIADVFYLPGESDPAIVLRQGVYLNRELLKKRLATRYPGN